MGALRAAAVTAGRASGLASRLLGRGGGTTLPGLVATVLDRHIVAELARDLPCGAIAVSGTNGKTTTCRVLASILRASGYRPVRNDSGSNLERGLASALVRDADLLGRLRTNNKSVGLFEVDEAALPQVLPAVLPRTVVLLDLFRDQLDRYGEVATVANAWSRAVAALPPTTTLAVNADDPLVTSVAGEFAAIPRYFGIETAERTAELEHAGDVKACPRCGGPIEYERSFLGHLGHYRCPSCGFHRPAPDLFARNVKLDGMHGSTFELHSGGESISISYPLPGMYNVYNALGAAAAARAVDIPLASIGAALQSVTAAFGRMEQIEIEGRTVYLALAKNPAGLNEVLRTLADSGAAAHLLVLLNDNIADGRDVSWIWDADVEMLAGSVSSVIFSGQRAEDMALRFKYAGVIDMPEGPEWSVTHDARGALDQALALTPPGDTLCIVPTYTAMLEIRQVLTGRGYVRAYWET